MAQFGKCTNYGNCEMADARESIEVEEGEDFICPECKKKLQATNKGGGSSTGGGLDKKILIAIIASIIAVLVGLVIYLTRPDVKTEPPIPDPIVVNPPIVDPPVGGGLTSADSLDIYKRLKDRFGGGVANDSRIKSLLDSLGSANKDLANKEEIIKILIEILTKKSGGKIVVPPVIITVKSIQQGFNLLKKETNTGNRKVVTEKMRAFFVKSTVRFYLQDETGENITNGMGIDDFLMQLYLDTEPISYKVINSEKDNQGMIHKIVIQKTQ